MASLTDDRAQLLLAGAFVLAVALLGLTIVLSAGNYTASLAGDSGSVSQGDDAITARESVRAGVRSYLRLINDRSGVSHSDREASLEAVTRVIGERTSEIYAREGRVLVVSPDSDPATEGTRIKQVNKDNFRQPSERGGAAADIDETWSLTNGGTVRNMTFHFSQLPASPPFELQFRRVSGTGKEWDLRVEKSGGNWLIAVEQVGSGPAITLTCERPRSSGDQTMDVTDATMDGTYCPALDAIEMGAAYDVVVKTPGIGDSTRDPAEGQFWVIARDPSAEAMNTGDPVETDAGLVYSTTVPFSYHSPAVQYEADLRVAPGEIE